MKAKNPDVSHEEITRRFAYDPQTGILSYRIAPPNQPSSLVGKEAGYIRTSKTGGKYRVVKIGKIAVYVHRLIWFYVFVRWPDGLIDHRNENTLDNRIDNLRPATQSKNKANCKKYTNNTSDFKGVTKHILKSGLKWKAQITYQQKVIYLGLYETKEAAHTAYLEAAKELQGAYSNPG